jgi:hypothetical protein
MKNLLWVIISGSLSTSSIQAAGILAGPVYNPATTHNYFLLTSSSWTDAEAAAESLGGHLVTVNDAAENDWILSAFSNFGGQPRALWTGLTDTAQEGVFTWSSGEPVAYTNWEAGQPDDGAGIYPHEDYVLIWPSAGSRSPGFWNDYIDTNNFTQFGFQLFGVVEVPTANNWTNPSSGKWESSSWSMGTLPASDQVVTIVNDGYKAVNIDTTSVSGSPTSLTVGSLEVGAPADGLSTLLLNYAGLNTPLKVLEAFELQTNGTFLNLSSSFEVDGTNGAVTIEGGTFIQDGGLTVVTGAVQVVNGTLNATNATMNLGPLQVGGAYPESGTLSQSGGTILSSGITIGRGKYSLLTNSTLYALGGTELTNTEASFVQTGGANYGDVDVEQGSYDLEDGLVQGVNLSTITLGTFTQNGGTVQVQNLSARGLGSDFSPFASYNLNTGTLYCATLKLSHYGLILQSGGALSITNGLNLFDPTGAGVRFELDRGSAFMPSLVISNAGDYLQRGGTNQVVGDISLYSTFAIYGGALSAANLGVGEGARVYQQGGIIEVSQVLSITGIYALQEGTVSVNGIYLRGSLTIESQQGSPPVLNNSGLINFGGTLAISASQNSLGQLGLSTNGTISLGGSSPVVRFADSSALNWDANSRLTIDGWSGSSTGNGSTQIYFGNSSGGLTPAQLSQIVFSVGPNLYSAKILSTGEIVPDQGSSIPSIVNSWTNSASGNWDQVTNWSLGVLPDSSQSVFITNSGWKAVAINPSTPTNFSGSMTVSNLTIRGSTNTENVLLLNSFGTAVPLTVSNGLTLQDDGRLLNFNSGLLVQRGAVLVTNSHMIQDGGLVVITNAQMQLSHAEYDITNGVFEAGLVWVGAPFFSTFNQYGGTVTITNLSLGPGNANGPHGGGYALYGGNLNLPGGLSLEGYPNNATSYLQEGGTNQTTQVYVSPESSTSFKLNGGLLADNNVSVFADNFGTAAIVQNGGSHVIANSLTIEGSAANGFTVLPATYSLNGGTLSAATIELDADAGDSVFVQSNATAFAGTIYAHSLGYYGSHNTSITLAGGTLSCSNLTIVDGHGSLDQGGGALVVTNLLTLEGVRDIGPGYIYYARYTLTAGTLSASNINVSGDLIIGDGTMNRISNAGYFSLSHTLQISNAVEQLGRFILATNATVDLAGSASQLSFANSSGEAWAGGATLVIANWNGNPSGGGAEQLKFGASQAGLTSAQLSQIQFRIGSSTNFYSAKILSTGEVVPDTAATPGVAFSQQGKNLILTWPAGWSLQSATNVPGPYVDIPGATPPYTNDTPLQQQQFFRLRQGP